MRYQIVYSDAAQYDLLKIWNDIYEVSADMNTADSYIDGIMNAFKKKQSFPRSGSPLFYRGLFSGVYFIHYKAYMILYIVRDQTVEAARILPVKTNYIKVLFPNPSEETAEN
ncbi:MAG: type II toxin-antitoxin system RelE/ParE family toxin [Bulleidia sp.]|nr:type II toxin-antitoxin system RelE/ParE family toxin [Bulleidia sp.]